MTKIPDVRTCRAIVYEDASVGRRPPMIEPIPANAFSARTRLVGRDAEFARLLAAIHDCMHGRPLVMLITGEPGVGKTRLLSEVIARTESELNVNVLSGFALEAGGTPYFPISRA